MSRFENLPLSKKLFSIHRDTPTPSFWGDTPTPSFNYKLIILFFFPGFHEFVKQTLFNQETQMHLENYRFGYSQIINVNSEINSNSPFFFLIIALNDPCYVISFITNMISLWWLCAFIFSKCFQMKLKVMFHEVSLQCLKWNIPFSK